MSGPDDNFLTRWSRRKQAINEGEAQPEDTAVPPPSQAAGEEQRLPGPLPPQSPNDLESPELLPRVDDLTADSDLAAFLRKGVPEELKRTAMRKMWSLDPAIRDYIGPSENAWDFNDPASIPGFGPPGSVASVDELLAKVMGNGPADPPQALRSTAPTEPAPGAPVPHEGSSAPSDEADDADLAAGPEPSPPAADQPSRRAAAAPHDADVVADATGIEEISRGNETALSTSSKEFPSRHGGAVPR